MEFNTKERRKSIKVIVSDEERALIEEKMKYYGYPTIASYIRDSAIYERVTYVDLKGQKTILDAFSENTKILKEGSKRIQEYCKYATQISKDDLEKISHWLLAIYKNQKSLLNLIDEKLDLDVWQEVKTNREVE